MTGRILRCFICLPALVACGLSACTAQPETLRGRLCAVHGCAAGCEELEVEPCDVAEPQCQRVVFQSLRCVRGGSLFEAPITQVNTAVLPSSEPSQPAQTEVLAAGEQVRLDAVTLGLKLLGLQGDTATTDEAEEEGEQNVIADYDPLTQMVSIAPSDVRWMDMLTLAHEYTHSLQDVEVSQQELIDRLAPNAKTKQGVRAFVEGEAQVFGFLTYAFMKRVDISDWDMADYFPYMLKGTLSAVAKAASPWFVAKDTLQYPIGFRYLWELWLAEGHRGVRRFRDDMDPNFSTWLDGYGGASALHAQLDHKFSCLTPEPPKDFRWIAQDSLGPSGVFAFAVRHLDDDKGIPLAPAWALTLAARGDVLRFYARRDPWLSASPDAPFGELLQAGNVIAEWQLIFQTEEHATTFAEAARRRTGVRVEQQTTQVTLISAASEMPSSFRPSTCALGG